MRGERTTALHNGARVNSHSMSTGEEILGRIFKRMNALGLSRNAVGIQAGLTRDIVRSIERGISSGRQRGVSSSTIEKLAPVLRTTPQWLLSGEGPEDGGDHIDVEEHAPEPETAPLDAFPSNIEVADVPVPHNTQFPRDVPVLGTAAGSIVRQVEGFEMERDVVDYVRRPPALLNNNAAYAFYVTGISMIPLHNDRDLRFADPRQRPHIGDSVVVRTRHYESDPGQSYIKILRRRTPSSVVLEQLNPQSIMEIPSKYIVSIHRVLTLNDLFGV